MELNIITLRDETDYNFHVSEVGFLIVLFKIKAGSLLCNRSVEGSAGRASWVPPPLPPLLGTGGLCQALQNVAEPPASASAPQRGLGDSPALQEGRAAG